MNDAEQVARLQAWRAFGDLFTTLREDSTINTLGRQGAYIQNG